MKSINTFLLLKQLISIRMPVNTSWQNNNSFPNKGGKQHREIWIKLSNRNNRKLSHFRDENLFLTCAIPVTEIGTPCTEFTWVDVTFNVITFNEILERGKLLVLDISAFDIHQNIHVNINVILISKLYIQCIDNWL